MKVSLHVSPECVGHRLGRLVRIADGNGPPCGSKHLVPRKEDLYDFVMLCFMRSKNEMLSH